MVSPALERLPLLPGAAAKGQEGPSRTWKMRPAAAGECNPPPEGGGKGGPPGTEESPPCPSWDPPRGARGGGGTRKVFCLGIKDARSESSRGASGLKFRPPSLLSPPVPACPLRVQGEEKGGTSDCDALPGRQAVAERS